MRIVRRLIRLLIVILVIVIFVVVGVVGTITYRSLPQTTGSLQVAGLEAPVSVVRDAAGIAHIYAENAHDLFLAQGYVHSQERLWQMEVWRHISAGRLSELFGASTLDQDRFIRTLGWRQAAERDLDALSPDAKAALEAYVDGVNAYIESHRGQLNLAFVVTGFRNGTGGLGGYEMEPWMDLDTVAWQKVQAWQLGGNFQTEVFRLLADAKLGDPALTDSLFPAYDPKMPVITPTGQEGSGGAGASATATTVPATRLTESEASGWRDVASLGDGVLRLAGLDSGEGLAGDHQVGSNNWVVGPSKSKSGRALLANDPHLGISMPSVWFMNGLHCKPISAACPYDVAGVSFPGVPAVILGHNAKIAWGATNVDPDVEDLFEEKIDPKNPDNYLFNGTSTPVTVRHETIKVAGSKDVEIDVRSTGHGPILNDVDPRLEDAAPLALRWSATADIDGALQSLFMLNTAQNFDEFHAALEGYGSPSQNFVYADADGHIGYVLPGHIPIRADAADLGARVRSGSDGKHEWTDWIPFAELPWQLDPASGVIVSANNAAVDAKYPHFVASEWDPGYRAKRIHELIDAAVEDGGVTIEGIGETQMDDVVLRAEIIRPLIQDATPSTPDGQVVLDRIRGWDGHAGLESLGAPAYLVSEYRLTRGLFDDELGDLAREYMGGSASWQATIAQLFDPLSPWWDDRTTSDIREDRSAIISAAIDQAGSDLRGALGDPQNWTWGKLHQATFREQTVGTSGIGPLEWYFNKGSYPVAGGSGAVNNTYYRPSRAYPNPNDPKYTPVGLLGVFEVTNLPSYRLAIDMGDLDGGRIVQTTGQSGNPFDSHYGDLIDAWRTGGTVRLPFSESAVEALAAQRLELVP